MMGYKALRAIAHNSPPMPREKPGDLWRVDGDDVWRHCCCGCGQTLALDHDVAVRNGDLPTVTPSVLCPLCGAHYYIRDGWVEPC